MTKPIIQNKKRPAPVMDVGETAWPKVLLRNTVVIAVAIVVSLALFQIMLSLISHSSSAHSARPAPIMVNTAKPKEQQSAKQSQSQPQAKPEPKLAPPDLPNTIPVAVKPTEVDITVDDIQLEIPEKQLAAEQSLWVQPALNGTEGVEYVGEADTGIRDIVPIATSRPNIPRLAWDNKIDGWVLVAFSVNKAGHVGDVRVMNAQPRGVFEAHAVAAVKGWRYLPRKEGEKRYISQRIEFRWKDYTMNIGEY